MWYNKTMITWTEVKRKLSELKPNPHNPKEIYEAEAERLAESRDIFGEIEPFLIGPLYLDSGTYIKSFFSVMYAPSCVRVSAMGDKHKRLHHRVSWKNAAPHIIKEKHKKKMSKG